jgi:hypothetical protein
MRRVFLAPVRLAAAMAFLAHTASSGALSSTPSGTAQYCIVPGRSAKGVKGFDPARSKSG